MRMLLPSAAAMMLAAASLAGTIHVPGDYPTIQAGIDAAEDGDEVVVADGTYSGPGNFELDTKGKAITVRSESGPAGCLIDCEGQGRGFSIHSGEGPGTVVDGFSITGPAATVGGGFSITASSPTIMSCLVDSATASSGGGLYCEHGSPDLIGCDFSYNSCSPGAGAGACFVDSHATVTDCTFSNNEGSGSGGGVYASGGSLAMTSCSADFNLGNRGAGVYASACDISLLQCSVRGNGGGVSSGIDATGGTVSLVLCTIAQNGDYGGGVRLMSTTASIVGCSITDNDEDKDQGRGGGVRIQDSKAVLVSCDISGNTVGYDFLGRGGGVYVAPDATAALVNCVIEGNLAFDHFFTGGEGGGVYSAGNLSLVGCTVRTNGGVSGAGVWASGDPTIHECLFASNNAAFFGGGMLLKGAASVTRCTFDGNHAWLVQPVGKGGGAVFIQGAPTFDACLFTGNTSDGQVGNGGDGGGAVWSDGAATIVNSIFSANSDTGAGFGGAMVTSGGDRIVNCVFYGNAVISGQTGALYAYQAGTTVANSIFRANGPGGMSGPLSVRYSDVEGGTGGMGNIDADPLLANPAAGDFRIGPGSPCIDAGDSDAVPDGFLTDFAGASRFADDPASPDVGRGRSPTVDAGAFEFPAPVSPCQTAEVLAPDGQAGDQSGYAALGPGALAIGAFANDAQGKDAGAVYLFEREGLYGWSPGVRLLAPGGHEGDGFGARVALDGDRFIAGSSRDDEQGDNAGAAYIFRHEGGAWLPETKLLPADPAESAEFGHAVSISGGRALCGAWKHDAGEVPGAGCAYIFRLDGGQWVQEAELVASDPVPSGCFGGAVDLRGDVAIIGAAGDGDGAGAAYIFRRAGDDWVQEARLEAPDGAGGDKFGLAVALADDRAVIGAPRHDHGDADTGGAYVFRLAAGGWAFDAELNGSLRNAGDLAGAGVAADGDLVAVGATGADDRGEDSGAAAVFRRAGNQWIEVARVAGDGAGPGDGMGGPVALAEGVLAAGASHHNGPGGQGQGAVYTFNLPGCPCYADMNQDGALDLFDFLAFQNLFVAADPAADCDGSGGFDLFDFLCYQNAFVAGC